MNSSSLNWRIVTIIFVTLVGILVISPNFVNYPKDSFLSKSKIRYGLDIQGGTHLVMGVEVEEILVQQLQRLGEAIQKQLTDEKLGVKSVQQRAGDKMKLDLDVEAADTSKIKEFISKNYNTVSVSEENGKLVLTTIDTYSNEKKKDTVNQAIETIRNRIDQYGVAEPSITAQGSDRILIQLPGIENSADAKDLINKTAKLDFMLVDYSKVDIGALIAEAEKKGNYTLGGETGLKYPEYIRKLNEDLAGKLPAKTRILFMKNENVESIEKGSQPYLLRTDTDLGGGNLRDASIRIDEYGKPEVNMTFDGEGTHKFAALTKANVNKQMAIVLDDSVYSAPNIQGEIPNGSARITMGGRDYQKTMKEAKTISMALRAGALPARLQQLEERTVGPSLGQDSITAGVRASYIGAALIFLFMLVYYKTIGLVANLGLIVNALLILAGLTVIDASLTLPGIAGMALTLGMAVDYNVIINERIKEELRRGANFHAAVREGYHRAFTAIFDSNITTVATSAVLIYFGTGPVRGFGVTLIVGVVASLFSSIFFTRTVVDILLYKFKIQKLSI